MERWQTLGWVAALVLLFAVFFAIYALVPEQGWVICDGVGLQAENGTVSNPGPDCRQEGRKP
jgi:UPF0716 family protein affecting phage T7 exclusion